MNFENLFPIAHNIVERVWVIWGFHTTVVIAVFGWSIKQRTKDFPTYLKKLSTIGYSIFFLVIIGTFIKTYLDIQSIVTDLIYFKESLNYTHNGYIHKMLTFHFWESISIPIFVCSIFFVFVLILIWIDKIWEKLKKVEY